MAAVQAQDDTITALRGDIHDLPDKFGAALEAALLRAASDSRVWAAAGSALQRHARDQAGGWLLGGLRALGTKLGWLLVIVGGVYLLGGWSALVALFKGAFAAHN